MATNEEKNQIVSREYTFKNKFSEFLEATF